MLGNVRRNDPFWNTAARKRGLAVLTWNVGQLWKRGRSFDETDAWSAVDYKRLVDRVTRAWVDGVEALAENTPSIRGKCSSTATPAGDSCLAVTRPKVFSAVVIHNGSSFPKPNKLGTGTVWLLSNGRADGGVADARRFDRASLAVAFR